MRSNNSSSFSSSSSSSSGSSSITIGPFVKVIFSSRR
jgi:hypothetical protein